MASAKAASATQCRQILMPDRTSPEQGLMNLSKYRCPKCQKSQWLADSTHWSCQHCGQKYSCVNGIPRLYLETELGDEDKELRDKFYNGLLGRYYQDLMPFLSLPVRPAGTYWKGWLVYSFVVFLLLSVVASAIRLLLTQDPEHLVAWTVATILAVLAICLFFFRHPYLFYLIVLAVPVKLSLVLKRFSPVKSFQEIHSEVIGHFLSRPNRLQVLDISTGTCNSLYRHGWMKLNADYTGLDLSETMLLQGQWFMREQQVPIDFILADATCLPLQNETFDIVLNYGAVNGFANPKLALEEMARVTKTGGLVLFLDEQLYKGATLIERTYFRKVLSSHNVIHRCPVELIPDSLKDITVHQVYHFYYLCTCYKK